MLCFVFPVVPPRPALPPRPHGRALATAAACAIAVSALFTPVAWIHDKPVFRAQVGVPARLGPSAHGGQASGERSAFRADPDDYGAVPPGLAVDAATGALVGTPTLAGTYTVSVRAAGGASRFWGSQSFQVRVLPAS